MIKKIEKFLKRFFMTKEECFEKYKSSNGKCYGVVGGTSATEYLSESCIGCKYHTMIGGG